jgi:hypothetical protein
MSPRPSSSRDAPSTNSLVEVRSLLVTVAILLLGAGVVACGGADRSADTARHGSSSGAEGAVSTSIVHGVAADSSHLEGDEDDDDSPAGYTGSSANDDDSDFDNDRKREAHGYLDGDDSRIVAYGHAASASQEQTIKALVRRYYAAAATRNGARACPMISSALEKAIPEDYAKAAHARGREADSCRGVMSLLFAQAHREVVSAFVVMAVRIGGSQARVLLGSRTSPASYVGLQYERATWRFDSLFPTPLP